MKRMFETRSHSWREAGLARQLSRARGASARGSSCSSSLPLLGAILFVYYAPARRCSASTRRSASSPSIALLTLGWQIARDVGRSVGPALFRRMDPATAGTVGFLHPARRRSCRRSWSRCASPGSTRATLAVGGAFTAVIVGLAAQQTLGNLFAGTVLLSARPFRVGDRVRLQGGRRRHDRGRRQLARPALHDASPAARTRSWSPTASCSASRSSRCASPRASTCARGCPPASRRARSRSCCSEHVADADARASRGSCSRSSTATRSSCASQATPEQRRRRPAARQRGARSRGAEPRAATTSSRRQRRLALVRLTGAELARRSSRRPVVRLEPRGHPGATPANARARRASPSGATSTSPRLRSIARTTRRRRPRSGVLVPTKPGSFDAGLGEHAGVADEAGEDDADTPTPRGAQVAAQALARSPRRPNFVAL